MLQFFPWDLRYILTLESESEYLVKKKTCGKSLKY